MERTTVGVLHPGNMGISVAASIQRGGHAVCWASEGRSRQTRERAERFHLHDAGTLPVLCKTCEVIVSVCPPHAAEGVAEQVLAQCFRGLYLDVNAISPQRSVRIGQKLEGGGASFVDGGIIGGPAWEPGRTWLYLAGERAGDAAALFAAGPMETVVMAGRIGQASALKMCYAAHTKGTTALLCAILAVAEGLGVRGELAEQWSRGRADFPKETVERVRGVTAKAWRFVGEMQEIAATFQEAGLPGGFHLAAAEVYERMARYKDEPARPTLDQVLASLMEAPGGT